MDNCEQDIAMVDLKDLRKTESGMKAEEKAPGAALGPVEDGYEMVELDEIIEEEWVVLGSVDREA